MNFSRTISLILILAAGMLWAGCDRPATEGGAGGATPEAEVGPVEPAEWLTDYEAALAMAREQGRPVLMNFTGSDWCPPCKLLKRDVFETDEFARYADGNLILVEVDFPLGHEQEPELVKQNGSLQGQYKIESFPTLIVLDPQGAEEKRTIGYMEGGPGAFIRWIEG